MFRRDFLKLGSLFSIAVLMPTNPLSRLPSFPVEAEAHGYLYRGTRDGDVYLSEDAGSTWRLHTRFGPEFAITRLAAGSKEQLMASIEYKGYAFRLSLAPRSQIWRTI